MAVEGWDWDYHSHKMFGFKEVLVKSLKVYRWDGSMDVFSLKFISQDLIWNIDAKESEMVATIASEQSDWGGLKHFFKRDQVCTNVKALWMTFCGWPLG